MNTPHPVVAVIGPSGSGKSSVVRELHRRGLVSVRPTWTTRPRRADEHSGSVEHRFVSEANFSWLERHGYFLDTTTMFGLPYRYGMPGPATFGVDLPEVVMLRAPLVEQFARYGVDFVVVQIEDTPERTYDRLVQRNVDVDELQARLDDNEHERILGRRVADFVFVNDDAISTLADQFTATVLRSEVAA
jgi:guanylate kinase